LRGAYVRPRSLTLGSYYGVIIASNPNSHWGELACNPRGYNLSLISNPNS